MPKKIRPRQSKRTTMEDDIYLPLIGASFQDLQMRFFGNIPKIKDKIDFLRSIYSPHDDEDYFKHGENFNYQNYDGTPINSIQRATAGFLTYHVSPNTRYFGMSFLKGDILQSMDEKIEQAKKVKEVVRDNHRILQQSDNMITYGKCYRDKILFNFTGKVIEDDPFKIAKLVHYEPENLLALSSNGRDLNVFGVKEQMNAFQATKRFGPGDYIRRPVKLYDMEKEWYYRYNVKRSDLYLHFTAHPDWDNDKMFQNYVRKLLKVGRNYKGTNDYLWVDFWTNDTQLISLEIREYRNIIISQLNFSNYGTGIGKGIGELASPTHCLLTELEVINLTAYERTYDPSYAVHSESEALGFDLGRSGYVFFDDPKSAPQNLSLNSNIPAAVEYKNYIQNRFDRICMLDVFQLINKSRMTGKEVDIRNTEGSRFLGPYVIQDDYDDLNPTVKAVHSIALKHKKATVEERSWKMNAFYTSPLTRAHKMTAVEDTERMAGVILALNNIIANETELTDSIDVKQKTLELLREIDDTDWFRDILDAKTKSASRIEKERLAVETAQQNALTASSNAIRASQDDGGEEPTP